MGEKKVSCSSKGDSLLYSWTLDGRPLTDSDLVPKGSNTNNVHLKLQTVGKLVCHVQNKVSESSGEVKLTTCGYIFINCTLSNGTDILQWVLEATNTLCVDPTTAPMGVENHCDGRQNNAQCYAALDGSIFIRLMDSAVENHTYMWSKYKSILLVVKNKHVIMNTLEKRADFTTQNGIYRINQLKSSDSGQYRLDVFVDGGQKEERKLNLSFQAPVSSVQLVPTCLSMGEKKVSCSSKGDSLLYSWTLDGRPLTDSDLVPKGSNTNIIHLKLQTVGKLVCHVQNKVSKSSGEVTLTTCGYIFINCTLSNGTDILQWVLEATNTLCVDPTTAPMGVENHCDGRQNNAQCYAALDGSIFIRLMDSAVENHTYNWNKDKSRLLVVNNKRVITNTLEKRADFTTQNGIYRINQLKSSDSGQYRLEVFVDGGKKEEERILNLSVQAPVSSVQLVPTCLSMGEKKVSCSSKGDSLLYSWTLDGRPLTDSDLVPKGSNTNIIHLKLQTVGKLVCHVQNNVSKSSGEVTLTTCGYIFINCTLSNGTDILQWVLEATNTLCVDPTTAPMGTVPLIGISLSALVFILLLALVVICVQKKKPNKPKEPQDDQELTYAAVKVVQRPGTLEVHRSEAEVEYGEVKFSQQPRQIQVPPDDCVYARVCK
ncbi:uncharacterized protein LOC114470848 isoform X12 [Gouania willdenowi]|uniref:uncharacterized protein LOC114470848 isoform X12 n=1 Tax=Gouania willdenowi TaxID=441366 RepID=UPI001054704D|nr:uncharacterized protein LOC114470848 isoform X12 [Gouania willdenowi]